VFEEREEPRAPRPVDRDDDAGIVSGRSPANLPLAGALRAFHDVTVAYLARDQAFGLDAMHDAVGTLADIGRQGGARPEDLIVLLKQSFSSVAALHDCSPDDVERLKERFVTWLIDAYFGPRAD
jgi:hypothetical protein